MDQRRRRFVVLVAVVLLSSLYVGAVAISSHARSGRTAGGHEAFLPLVGRPGMGACAPTLGPSPTPTRTPTCGPTATPWPTPSGRDLDVMTVANRDLGWPGKEILFSVGAANFLGETVQLTFTETLPDEIAVEWVLNLNCTSAVTTGYAPGSHGGRAVIEIAGGSACQLMVLTKVVAPCGNCYVWDGLSWSAMWTSGYKRSGASQSQRIHVLDVQPTLTPSPVPTTAPTLVPTPTPTLTPVPTLGPSSTPGG